MKEPEARQHLLDSVNSGSPPFGIAAGKAFTALPAAARATVVDASFAWMKVYVNSAAYKTAYATARENMKPTAPAFDGTVDQELKRKLDDQAQQIAEGRKMLSMLPADQRAAVESALKSSEAMAKNPQMIAGIRSQIEQDRASAQAGYQDDLKKWQENYPANPLVLVGRRLQAFLTASADVDFAAKTVLQNGKQRFVNPAYESKSGEWKLCFRAGKEAVTAARTAATAWLKELPK